MRRLQALLMPVGPFLGAGWVRRDWPAFWCGWVSFLLSQAVHIPLLWSLVPLLRALPFAVMLAALCLLAGLCEEPARLAIMLWRFPSMSVRQGVMLGLGHGACEAFVLGLLVWFFGGDSVPLHWRVAAVVERCLATALHVRATLLVRRGLLLRAVLLHGAFNLLVVSAFLRWGVWAGEGLGLLLAVGMLWEVRGEWSSATQSAPPASPGAGGPPPKTA